MNSTSSPQSIIELSQLCCAFKILKKKNPTQYAPIKVAYYPYETSRKLYKNLQNISKVWQKLIFLASRNPEFIEKVYEQISETDPMISRNLKIFKSKNKINADEKDSFTFTRSDYFIDEQEQCKLIEYNLLSVSMSAHCQNFQKAKKLSDPKNEKYYVDNNPNEKFVTQISEIYHKKGMKGLFVFIVSEQQTNIVEQKLIEMKLIQKGIDCKRIPLIEVQKRIKIDESNNLHVDGELISIVYYRTGYQMSDFQKDEEICWRGKQTLEKSNALKIPTVTMDLMNQKRMQVQLSKESVFSKYLTPQQSALLKTSLVPSWQFDNISEEQFSKLLNQVQLNPTNYILKPNLEGGGHNIYGQRVFQYLKSLDREQRKKYILMEKIETKPIQNILIDGKYHHVAKTVYEVSQFGIIQGENNELAKNEAIGFCIRIKPIDQNQGGIMAGVGSICSWIVKQPESHEAQA